MNEQQNQFYTSIAKYYSEIFPYNPAQLIFIKNRAGELVRKQILDIGCATGELAFHLAEAGAKVTGIDLNEDLLNQAWSNKTHPNCTFKNGNMLALKTDYYPGQFDLVLCFGNTLVHLENNDQVQLMFNGAYSVLQPGGHFLIQILNYDYILEDKVSELPLIETENIRFIRNYQFQENSPLVGFQTDLFLKKENQKITNETTLFALKSTDLGFLLKSSGFSKIKFFSNFKQDVFSGKHLPLVVSCQK